MHSSLSYPPDKRARHFIVQDSKSSRLLRNIELEEVRENLQILFMVIVKLSWYLYSTTACVSSNTGMPHFRHRSVREAGDPTMYTLILDLLLSPRCWPTTLFTAHFTRQFACRYSMLNKVPFLGGSSHSSMIETF